jgi:hypothetical protein
MAFGLLYVVCTMYKVEVEVDVVRWVGRVIRSVVRFMRQNIHHG